MNIHIQVCKNQFMAIHVLQNSRGRINSIINQTAEGRSVAKPGGRGKHANYKFKITPQQTEYVHDHIHSAPKYKIHCSRDSKPTETYFDCGLPVSRAYRE
jgi:hypothetical protein